MLSDKKLTWGHKGVGDDDEATQDEESHKADPSPKVAHGDGHNHLGWEVNSSKDHLDEIDADTEILEVHGQAVVGETDGEPIVKMETGLRQLNRREHVKDQAGKSLPAAT